MGQCVVCERCQDLIPAALWPCRATADEVNE
jgi:hypothetical protein